MATQLEVIDYENSNARKAKSFLRPASPINLPSPNGSAPWNTNSNNSPNLHRVSSSPENRLENNGLLSLINPQPPIRTNPLLKASNSDNEARKSQVPTSNPSPNPSRAQSPMRPQKTHTLGRTSYLSGDESSKRRNSEDSPLSVLSTYFDAQKDSSDLSENQNPSQTNSSSRSDLHSQQVAGFVEAVKRNDMASAHDILQSSNSKRKILDGIHPVTGYTALTLSITDGNEAACRKLLDWGSDPNTKDASQVPPLIHAVKGNREEIVKVLLKKCAFINVVDAYNRTPLHFACEKNNRSIVKILLVAGANILSKDVNGYSPLQLSESAFIQALFKKHCERHGMDYAEVASEVQAPRSPSIFSYKDIDSRSERSMTDARSESRSGFSDFEYGGRREEPNQNFDSDSSSDTLMERTEASLLDMAILAAKLGKLENFDIDSLIQELSLMKNNRDAVALKSKLENLQNRKEKVKDKAKDKIREFEKNSFRNESKDAKEKGESRLDRINGHNPLRIITNDPLSVENGVDHHDPPMMSAGISRRRQSAESGNEEVVDRQQKLFAFKPTPPPSPPPSSILGGVVQTDFHRNQFSPTELKSSRLSPRVVARDHTHARDWDGMKFEQSSWAEFSGNETDVSGVNGGGHVYPSGLRRTSSGLPSSGYNSNVEDVGPNNFRNAGLTRRNVPNAGTSNGRERNQLGRTLSGSSVFSPDQKFTNVGVEGENLEEAVFVGGMHRPGERYENHRGGRMLGRWDEDGEDWGRNDQEMDYYYYYRAANQNPNPSIVVPEGAYYGLSREEFKRQPSFTNSSSSSRRTSPRNEPKPPPISRSGSTSSAYSNHHFEEGSGAKMFRARQGTRPTPLRLRPAINFQARNEKFGMYSDSEHAKFNGTVHKPVPPNSYQNPNPAPLSPNLYPNQNYPAHNPYTNVPDSPDPHSNSSAYFSPNSQPPSPPPHRPLSPPLHYPQTQTRREINPPEPNPTNISPRSSNPSPRSAIGDDPLIVERYTKAPSNEDLALIRPDWREDAAKGGCVSCGKLDCDDRSCLSTRDNSEVTSPSTPTAMELNGKPFDKNSTNSLPTNFKWQKGELLGEGAYGKVFAGLNQTTGELMAVKQLKILDAEQRSSHMDALEREISLYKTMRHRHIVGYIGMEKDVASGNLYVFLEFVSGGSIHSMLERFGKFSESLVRVYTRQLLLGLEYLHRCKIIHRDIKGGNVLVDRDGMVKLADFGASKAFNDTTFTDGFKSIRGSVFWMAPEVIKGDGYGRRADIWSVGCTVVEMLTATHPWPDIDNTWAAIFHIAKTTTGPPLPEDCSEDAKDFLNSCFHLDAKKRFSASELLKHPFVASVSDNVRDIKPHASTGN